MPFRACYKEIIISNGYYKAPDPDEVIREVQLRARKFFQHFSGQGLWLLLILPLIWLATGFAIIQPDQEGVMLRFGKQTRRVSPGPNWNWPWPMGRTYRVPVTRVQKIEVGFRTIQVGPPARYQHVPREALMLTGDENIVSLEFIVQYKIKDPISYLFKVRDPVATIHDAAEAAMRQVIGRSMIDYALTEGKGDIQQEAQGLLQEFMDLYEAGVQIVTVKLQDVNPPPEVNDAFKDVINAQQDKERKINEAKGFENDIIPAARGAAAQVINEAEAYKEARVTEAQGEASRFRSLLKEYRNAKVVTKTRLYLETMEDVLPSLEKIIVDRKIAQSTVPYLPLDQLKKKSKPK